MVSGPAVSVGMVLRKGGGGAAGGAGCPAHPKLAEAFHLDLVFLIIFLSTLTTAGTNVCTQSQEKFKEACGRHLAWPLRHLCPMLEYVCVQFLAPAPAPDAHQYRPRKWLRLKKLGFCHAHG